jgi:putative ABC transport system permease protein
MKKTSLYKDILREIQKTALRFLSILLMVALGSLIYVALNRTGPTMRDTIEAYVSEHRMYDMRISSPVGLDEEDRLVIDRLPGATEIEYSYFTDVTEKDLDRIVRIESLPDNISLIDLEKGRLPQKSDEILLDLDWMEKGVAIGDTVEFETKDDEDAPANLKHAAFTVVGFSHPSDSLFAVLKTQSATGGSIDHYAFALADAFDMEDISVARLRYADVAHLNST